MSWALVAEAGVAVGSWALNKYGGSSDKGGSSGGDPSQYWDDIINKYSYKPQYTAETEKGLYDLFNQTTGLGGGGTAAIPFDIGLPTTGLYDSLTRGIKEQYLGTPGGPEGGRVADTRAYYNNMGIPEYAANQERLANQDLNNSLTDTAAKINESQKDRLLQVLGLGSGIGSNLYAQDLAQQRFNTGVAANGSLADLGLAQSINSANNQAGGSLAGLLTSTLGTGGPTGNSTSTGLNGLLSLFGNKTSSTAPTSVNKSGGTYGDLTNLLGAGGSNATPKSSLFT